MSGSLKLFISHSSHDRETARAIINLVRAALSLKPEEIRCTSVDGYRLPVGSDTDERLREEILAAASFIGIVSPESIGSTYVLFEMGGRWGARKSLFPILAPGVKSDLLKGPLAGLNALSCDSESQLHQLVGDLAREVECPLNSPSTYLAEIKAVMSSSVNDEPSRAAPPEAGPSINEKASFDPTPEHIKVVRILVLAGGSATVPYMATLLSWSTVKVQHFVDDLFDRDCVAVETFTDGGNVVYRLTRQGRAFAVSNNIA